MRFITNIDKIDSYLIPICAKASQMEQSNYILGDAKNIYGKTLNDCIGIYIEDKDADTEEFINKKIDSRFITCLFLAKQMVEQERGK